LVLPSVTAPVFAKRRPTTAVPVTVVIDACAYIVPTNIVLPPSVADEPMNQNTLHACVPFVKDTVAGPPVVNVDDGARNTNTALAFPPPFSSSVPVRPRDGAPQYTPGDIGV
jgi:hypothetical protein